MVGRISVRKNWGAGLGVLGIVTLLTFLFGDAILVRAYSFFMSPASTRQEQPKTVPEPVPVESQGPTVVAQPRESGAITLFDRLCAAERMVVTFRQLPGDLDRYKRRSGTTIVAVPNCNEYGRTFTTRVGGQSVLDEEGIVAGNRIEFKYEYSDREGLVECRVAAAEKESLVKGTISCESSADEMKARNVSVQIG